MNPLSDINNSISGMGVFMKDKQPVKGFEQPLMYVLDAFGL